MTASPLKSIGRWSGVSVCLQCSICAHSIQFNNMRICMCACSRTHLCMMDANELAHLYKLLLTIQQKIYFFFLFVQKAGVARRGEAACLTKVRSYVYYVNVNLCSIGLMHLPKMYKRHFAQFDNLEMPNIFAGKQLLVKQMRLSTKQYEKICVMFQAGACIGVCSCICCVCECECLSAIARMSMRVCVYIQVCEAMHYHLLFGSINNKHSS